MVEDGGRSLALDPDLASVVERFWVARRRTMPTWWAFRGEPMLDMVKDYDNDGAGDR